MRDALFCRWASFDRRHIYVCGNEEAAGRRGGKIELQYASEGIPDWCPLPFAVDVTDQEEDANSCIYSEPKPRNHLCPNCLITRLDESGYCSKCEETFVIM